jgi:hypothetical protein
MQSQYMRERLAILTDLLAKRSPTSKRAKWLGGRALIRSHLDCYVTLVQFFYYVMNKHRAVCSPGTDRIHGIEAANGLN